MALSYQYRVTDTGGGSSGDNNRSQVVMPTSPYRSQTPTVTTKPVTSSTTRRTSTAKTPTATTSAATQQAATTKKAYTPYTRTSYPTYPSSYHPNTEPTPNNGSKNMNNYLKLLNETYTNEANQIANTAEQYKTEANQNLANAENRWNTTYNNVNNMLNNLENQNRARETATMDAINGAYNAIINNAGDYYNNLLDTYNRSMDFVNQGYNESVNTADQARAEAIQLAAQLYDMGEAQQNRDTERALKGQYASYMRGLRNMNQMLAAQGINGGASETAYLNALNGYEGNRTDLNEAKLAAIGALRQQQMQSDSEAQQNYLNRLSDFIQSRTNQQLGVENNRSQGEYNYANMKNEAESNKGNQLVSAQNNFQNWANNLVNQRSGNETSYADAIRQLTSDRNGILYNSANMSNQAAQSRSDNFGSQAYQAAVQYQSENNNKAKVQKTEAQKKKEAEKKKKEAEKKKKEKKKTSAKASSLA